jgi:ribosomal protein L40E
MRKTPARVCQECGARLATDATACDLCGMPVEDGAEEPQALAPAEAVPDETPVGTPAEASGPFCNQCGWHNPPGARFCSACGAKLQEVATGAPVPRPTAPEVLPYAVESTQEVTDRRALNRQVGILVGASALLVIVLFLVTVFSRDMQLQAARTEVESGARSSPRSVVEEHLDLPLPPQIAQQVATIEREMAGLDAASRLDRRRDLVNLYMEVGRLDRAAIEQGRVAELEDTPEAWIFAGNLYFDWMETIDGTHKTEVARLTIAAYQRVLEEQPDNLDVRTDLAWAYQYDPDHAMEAMNEMNRVLEAAPDHIQANFNRGIFLMRINRLEQAADQFERVKQIVGEDNPIYGQAAAVIEAIREHQRNEGT